MVWWMQLRAYARVYKFSEALGDALEADMPANHTTTIDETTPQGQRQAAAVKRNDTAVSVLTVALKTKSCIVHVLKAKTTAWPEGEAHLIVASFKKKYQPGNITALSSQSQELQAIFIEEDEDPATLFGQLTLVESQYKGRVTDLRLDEQLAVVI